MGVMGVSRLVDRSMYLTRDESNPLTPHRWETITAYTPCPEPVKITKGDNLTMEAFYDLTQHRL